MWLGWACPLGPGRTLSPRHTFSFALFVSTTGSSSGHHGPQLAAASSPSVFPGLHEQPPQASPSGTLNGLLRLGLPGDMYARPEPFPPGPVSRSDALAAAAALHSYGGMNLTMNLAAPHGPGAFFRYMRQPCGGGPSTGRVPLWCRAPPSLCSDPILSLEDWLPSPVPPTLLSRPPWRLWALCSYGEPASQAPKSTLFKQSEHGQPLWVRNPKVVSLWFWLRVYWEAAVQMLVWASLGLRICEMAPCDDCWQEGTPMGVSALKGCCPSLHHPTVFFGRKPLCAALMDTRPATAWPGRGPDG